MCRLVPASGDAGALHLCRDPALPSEAYTLEARNTGIYITAAGEPGVIQALTSLWHFADGRDIPCFSLSDSPRYAHRGFMLDCVRHFFEAAEIERILEEMALVKMNVFHWHLSDDQGWRIESAVYPRLNEKGGAFYTKDEIRRILVFARERGIQVIPEIDLPGHTTALLAAYPELSCQGEQLNLAAGGGIYPIILCAGKESVYSFLYPLLDEVCGLFDGPLIHLGGDEAPKAEWERCEHCKGALEKHGLADF